MYIGTIMHTDLVTVPPDTTLVEARELIESKGIDHLLVYPDTVAPASGLLKSTVYLTSLMVTVDSAAKAGAVARVPLSPRTSALASSARERRFGFRCDGSVMISSCF